MNRVNQGMVVKVRGVDVDVDKSDKDGVVFVDDDRWQFAQNFGMHLGYFWCLSDLNELTDECLQRCEGAGVTMDSICTTSVGGSKKKADAGYGNVLNTIQRQMTKNQ